MIEIIIKFLGGVGGAAGFCFVFNERPRRIPFAALCAAIACGLLFLFEYLGIGPFWANFAGTLAATVLSEVFAKCLRSPATVYLLPALIPLVPGSSLYYAMRALIAVDWDMFGTYMVATLTIGLGIAAGIVIGTLFNQIIFRKNKKRRQ